MIAMADGEKRNRDFADEARVRATERYLLTGGCGTAIAKARRAVGFRDEPRSWFLSSGHRREAVGLSPCASRTAASETTPIWDRFGRRELPQPESGFK